MTHEIGGSALVIPGAKDPGHLTFDVRADELGRAAAGRTKVARPCKTRRPAATSDEPNRAPLHAIPAWVGPLLAFMVRNAMKNGLPGDRLRLVTGSYRRGGPLRCCTLDWISAASVSISICSTARARRSTSALRRRTPMVFLV